MEYDVAVVGGGIVGAGVARDAALRGLKVALFEKDDFGSGTTSRSTRLVHGGLRYLQHYDFALVHEALTERRTLLRIAPHLVRPLRFLLPVYKRRSLPLPLLWAGLLLYDYLQPRRGLPHHRYLPPGEALRIEPRLAVDGLRGAFEFYDGQCLYPERLCLENVLDAADHDASVSNHTEVVGFLEDAGRIRGVRVRNTLTGDERSVQARIVLNCAGPWIDEVERRAIPTAVPRLRRTKGVHLVVPRFVEHALLFGSRDGTRVVFAIPWGAYSLIGTTDTDYEGTNEDVRTQDDDVDYLLTELARVTSVRLARADVLYTTAGIRPLQRQLGRSTAAVTRREQVIDHEKVDGRAGLVTVVGGKITTYRAIAELVVDFLLEKLGYAHATCLTASTPLPGGHIQGAWDQFRDDVVREARRHDLDAEVGAHLADLYGAEAFAVLDAIHHHPSLGERIQNDGPWILAELEHAIVVEHATTLTDVLLRRVPIGLTADQGRRVAPRVAAFLGDRLRWAPGRREKELRDYYAALDRNWVKPSPRGGPPLPTGP